MKNDYRKFYGYMTTRIEYLNLSQIYVGVSNMYVTQITKPVNKT